MKVRSFGTIACIAGASLLCISSVAVAGGGILVADAGNAFSADADGAIHFIPEVGDLVTIAYGGTLVSPAAMLPVNGNGASDTYFVTDIGALFSAAPDGQVHLVDITDGSVEEVYSGAPLVEPFGMLRRGGELFVSDFGLPGIFAFTLDWDGDGHDGPFPVPTSAIRVVYSGAPFNGPNQMVAWKGSRTLVADDSGQIYEIDLAADEPIPVAWGPAFVDPVGLAKATIPASSSLPGAAVVFADAATQDVYAIDNKGENSVLLLAGDPGSQFLGLASGHAGQIALVDAHGLFGAAEDGEVLVFDRGSVRVAHSGAPLINPFSVLFVPGGLR